MILHEYKSETLWKVVAILSVVGIALACYLLYNTLSAHPLKACNVNAWINCGPVTTGNLAYFFGIPVALIGLIGYLVILASSIAQNKKLLLGMTSFGMLFCLRLTILEIFVERIICPVCVLCQLIMLTVFIISIVLFKRKEEKTKIQKLKDFFSSLFGKT